MQQNGVGNPHVHKTDRELESNAFLFSSLRLSEFRAGHEPIDAAPRTGGQSLPRPESHRINPPKTPVDRQTRTPDIL